MPSSLTPTRRSESSTQSSVHAHEEIAEDDRAASLADGMVDAAARLASDERRRPMYLRRRTDFATASGQIQLRRHSRRLPGRLRLAACAPPDPHFRAESASNRDGDDG